MRRLFQRNHATAAAARRIPARAEPTAIPAMAPVERDGVPSASGGGDCCGLVLLGKSPAEEDSEWELLSELDGDEGEEEEEEEDWIPAERSLAW